MNVEWSAVRAVIRLSCIWAAPYYNLWSQYSDDIRFELCKLNIRKRNCKYLYPFHNRHV